MAILNNQWQQHVIQKGTIQFTFLATGDVFKIMDQDHQVNLLHGNPIDGMISNLYLREKIPTGYRVSKLIGVHSPSTFSLTADGAIYEGTVFDVAYQVHLIIHDKGWFYQLHLRGGNPQSQYDVMYGQDVGIAHPFGILSNEAYTSQYIDHQVFQHEGKTTLLSRQNQGNTHYLQIGTDTPIQAYCTDAMQFFGLDYKLTHTPKAYQEATLPSKNYQYEFAYLTLQTSSFSIHANMKPLTFYGYSHRETNLFVTKPFASPTFPTTTWTSLQGQSIKPLLNPSKPIAGKPLSKMEYLKSFPTLKQVEIKDETFLSGFLPDGSHLISQQKELLVERPHGHILLSGDVLHASEDVFATTAYMFGVFGSHTVYGNTNFHKLTGDLRHPLNAHTISGTRLYIEQSGVYQILGMPSYLIMGLDKLTWTYILPQDVITITLAVNGKDPLSKLTFASKENRSYRVLVSQQYLLDTNEYNQPITYTFDGRILELDGRSNGMINTHYPGLRYRCSADQPFSLTLGREMIPKTKEDGGMVFFSFGYASRFTFYTEATLKENFSTKPENVKFEGMYDDLIHTLIPLRLTHPTKQEELDPFNFLVPWYVHDALVHYASPHGLEQYNGAAWGTRDVLQGPFELFLTAQRFDLNKEILLKVFARQFSDTKEFPQWFMFDNYRHIQAHESHGDVLVWPLKALASYLDTTGDMQILSTQLPYMDKHLGQFTKDKKPLYDHVWDILDTLQKSSIQGTSLPAYGGGDWDDTLQPANQTLTKQMVSAWTVALLFETLTVLTKFNIFSDKRQQALIAYKEAIEKDFNRYLIVDGVPAGFIIFYPDRQEVLLHPNDQTTGLKYRLLPFNRGLISQIFDPNQIKTYQTIINTHLRHPDGVRLMNTAVTYQGGKKTYFQRAETAANFGREIGIQYVHAHIRYIEAMCTIGDADEAWWGLNVINPIGMQRHVPHAELRQRNVYFSSSDAAFLDRYEAKKDFEKVRLGKVKVKAGWRLYSSGPGIYLQTLIQQWLGIRVKQNQLLIDPQIPSSLAGLNVEFHFQGRSLTMAFQDNLVATKPRNRYRLGIASDIKMTTSQVIVILKP
jgi:1,2-beta-oligoglucan phosphorylase